MKRLLLALMILCCMAVAGCDGMTVGGKPRKTDLATPNQKPVKPVKKPPTMCLALRGNGQLITGHFAAMARLLETYGLFAGASGGSSGSVSIFLLESVQKNPVVTRCGPKGEKACDPEVAGQRAALLMKSMQGYIAELQAAANGERGRDARTVDSAREESAVLLTDHVLAEPEARGGALALPGRGTADGAQALALLRAETSLLNPEVALLLGNDPKPFHVQDLLDGLENFGKFTTDSLRILLRPGFVNFGHSEVFPTEISSDALSAPKLISRAADFYAGYEPVNLERMRIFVDGCAGIGRQEGRGANWDEVAELHIDTKLLPADDRLAEQGIVTCGELFADIVDEYRTLKTEGHPSRLTEQVGDTLPALISTAVLVGQTADRWQIARKQYMAGQEPIFEPVFEDVKFGYFAKMTTLDTVMKGIKPFKDEKSRRFLPLGPATWQVALTYSPAEPGISRALEISEQEISAGGWSDLHPSLVLKGMGCSKVVYVTSEGEDNGFAAGMVRLLDGADKLDALYSVAKDSALARSLAGAEARVCTNWNKLFDEGKALDVAAVSADAYNADIETTDPFFARSGLTKERLNRPGCTPPKGMTVNGPAKKKKKK